VHQISPTDSPRHPGPGILVKGDTKAGLVQGEVAHKFSQTLFERIPGDHVIESDGTSTAELFEDGAQQHVAVDVKLFEQRGVIEVTHADVERRRLESGRARAPVQGPFHGQDNGHGSVVELHDDRGARLVAQPQRLLLDRVDEVEHPAILHPDLVVKETAELLVKERHISGIGIDTASIDYGPSQDFVVHRIVNAAGLYGLENVAGLAEVPASGARLVALPMKIAGGTGAPVRIIALLPPRDGK